VRAQAANKKKKKGCLSRENPNEAKTLPLKPYFFSAQNSIVTPISAWQMPIGFAVLHKFS
jgi:hypothetical protein